MGGGGDRRHPLLSLILLFSVVLSLVATTNGWELHVLPAAERLQHRRSGENLLVVCSARDFDGLASDAKIEWFTADNGDKPIARLGRIMTIARPLSSQLMFIKPRVEDAGTFTCRITIGGETKEESVAISFVQAAEFVNVRSEQHPVEDELGKVVCEVKGDSSLEVFWQLNGKTLDEGDPRGYRFENDRQTLIIPDYKAKTDDGVYTCNAAQFASFETLAINVTGYARPSITVFEHPENGVGYEGQNVELKCQATGWPRPHYNWYKLEESGEQEQLEQSDKYTLNDGLLVVHQLSVSDRAEYRCDAVNEVGPDSKTANISVFLKPRIEKMPNVTLSAGGHAVFTCKFTGDGLVDAWFRRNGLDYKIAPEPTTTEEPAESTDSAESDEEEETEDGEGGENTTPPFLPRHDWEDDELTADNSSNNEEQDEEKRARRDTLTFVDTTPASDRVIVRKEGDHAIVLEVAQVEQTDGGIYECVAENAAGQHVRLSHLFVTHPPSIVEHSESKVRLPVGAELRLQCEASAVPDPVWRWEGPDGTIEANDVNVKLNNEPLSSELVISSAQEFGVYKCQADNKIGSPAEHEFTVVKVVVPTAPVSIACHERMFPNYAECSLAGYADVDEGARPTILHILVADYDASQADDFDWTADGNEIRTIKIDYDGHSDVRVPGLVPTTRYAVRIRALNELGASDLSDTAVVETTSAWGLDSLFNAPTIKHATLAPSKFDVVEADCSRLCRLSWTPPNDHGAPLTGYRLTVHQFEGDFNAIPRNYVSPAIDVELAAEAEWAELAHLKPLSNYEVELIAENAVGTSLPYTVVLHTSEHSGSLLPNGLSSTRLLLVAVALLCVLLILLDVICFARNRWGLLACICLNCCGRDVQAERKMQKTKDPEAGHPEENKLLTERQHH